MISPPRTSNPCTCLACGTTTELRLGGEHVPFQDNDIVRLGEHARGQPPGDAPTDHDGLHFISFRNSNGFIRLSGLAFMCTTRTNRTNMSGSRTIATCHFFMNHPSNR
ncbi:MAG: hypothetical protein QOF58_1524 [Pseudonocardiales bacterium]|nr:hypothetical protein [Pseudonocardiales bacterium]